jgi:hypothetical protein
MGKLHLVLVSILRIKFSLNGVGGILPIQTIKPVIQILKC